MRVYVFVRVCVYVSVPVRSAWYVCVKTSGVCLHVGVCMYKGTVVGVAVAERECSSL